MKPKFSKPFNLAHAQAGAPYSFDDGESAEIIAWSRAGAMSLVSMKGAHQSLVLSRVDGTSGGMATLAMLPLGMIDGKPVFVGDSIEMNLAQGWSVVKAASTWAGTWVDDGKFTRWPAPAKVYPQTLMSVDLIEAECHGAGGSNSALFRIANAAIKHAVDFGQVVIADDRDARDWSIAKAVHTACMRANNSPDYWADVKNMDLFKIILEVQ
jgi:hypothetical protein